jgi:hypothetical protein
MDNKKEMNWFFCIYCIYIGLTLIKHIDFKNLTLKEPLLDILYFFLCLLFYLMIKDLKTQTNKTATNRYFELA